MTGGAALPHFFKQLGTGHQPQYGPRQHQSKIYAGIYKDASTQTLLSGPVSSSAPETDSPASDLDAEGYQPQPQPQNEICLPFYNDPNSQQLLDGQNLLDGVKSSSSKKKKHKKRSDKKQQPVRPKRKHSPKTFKRDPNDPETPYNSLWESKENYKRVDIQEYLKKCQSVGPHPRSSYAGFVQSERFDRRFELGEGDSLAYPSGTPTGQIARRAQKLKASMAMAKLSRSLSRTRKK
ncbi:hypothetical protein N7533_008002 [Penicillium manginii]|uniref:uncharacterized protein n=1 Tax=Penicillium manginii TaxID=203109 RepID=UPI0025474D3D|nr:uncharacterized protein N7533_008002 [Penicillium manginii]KAJ5750974.1 hypothetical protein N7533_008002 [Penicillium manginii]